MENNKKGTAKYHYVQIVGDWTSVSDYVNNKGYEIWQMCPIQDQLVYLLRKELDYTPKEIG